LHTPGVALIDQIAALPYRRDADGVVRVLLITSRDTKRWVVPKGNPIRGLTSHLAAEREAFEEAGITGTASPVALGRFRYVKRRRNGAVITLTVAVFPMEFAEQMQDWPEKGQRECRWFSVAEAADAVDEPDLRALILGFQPLGGQPVAAAPTAQAMAVPMWRRPLALGVIGLALLLVVALLAG